MVRCEWIGRLTAYSFINNHDLGCVNVNCDLDEDKSAQQVVIVYNKMYNF